MACRRYLRARKFVPRDALAQFNDTEQWRKFNNLEALYEQIDISDYREARGVVSMASSTIKLALMTFSTLNGQVVETSVGYRSIFSRWGSWIRRR